MDFETAIYLTAILEVVTLICFFVLCSNVGAIKKRLSRDGATPTSAFSLYMGLGEIEKAKQVLIEMILADTAVQNTLTVSPEALKGAMAKYNGMMKEIGLVFDAEKAFQSKKIL